MLGLSAIGFGRFGRSKEVELLLGVVDGFCLRFLLVASCRGTTSRRCLLFLRGLRGRAPEQLFKSERDIGALAMDA